MGVWWKVDISWHQSLGTTRNHQNSSRWSNPTKSTETQLKPGDEGRRAAVHLVLGAVPGDAGEVGHVGVHQEHVASLHYHTEAPTSGKLIFDQNNLSIISRWLFSLLDKSMGELQLIFFLITVLASNLLPLFLLVIFVRIDSLKKVNVKVKKKEVIYFLRKVKPHCYNISIKFCTTCL